VSSVELVQPVPEYFDVSAAAADPFSYDRKIGSGLVPAAPV
jgi:hypothetical protein